MAFNFADLLRGFMPQQGPADPTGMAGGAPQPGGFSGAIQTASPLLLSLAAGMRSGDPYAHLGEGIQAMQDKQGQKEYDELLASVLGGGQSPMAGAMGSPVAGAPTGFTGLGSAPMQSPMAGAPGGALSPQPFPVLSNEGPMQPMPGTGRAPVGASAAQTMPGTGGGPVGDAAITDLVQRGAPPQATAQPARPGDANVYQAAGATGGGSYRDAVIRGLQERFPPHIAQAFAMNIADESGFDPTINERNPMVAGSRGGFGLAQWTGPRRKQLEQFAQARGTSPGDLNTQLDFLVAELQGPERAAGQAIMSSRNAGEAASAIVNKFLRPAEEHRARREAKYLGGAPMGGGGASGGAGVPAGRFDNVPMDRLFKLLSSPYGDPVVKQIIGGVLQQRLAGPEQMTPYQQAQLGLAQQEFDYQRQQDEAAAKAGPSPDERYKVVGGRLVDVYAEGGPQTVIAGSENAQSAIGKLRADLDAGRISQEQFDMAVQNMAPPGMTIESDGAGGFRMTQGTNVVGRPLTEAQSKDNVYSTRAKGALADVDTYGNALTGWWQNRAEGIPFDLGRFAQTPEFQMGRNAGDEFLTAILRKDTGAAITREEQAIYGRMYLPQPGDSSEVLARKAEARNRAVAALESGMSPEQILATERALGIESSPSPAAAPPPITATPNSGGRNAPRTAPTAPPAGLTEEDLQFLGGS